MNALRKPRRKVVQMFKHWREESPARTRFIVGLIFIYLACLMSPTVFVLLHIVLPDTYIASEQWPPLFGAMKMLAGWSFVISTSLLLPLVTLELIRTAKEGEEKLRARPVQSPSKM